MTEISRKKFLLGLAAILLAIAGVVPAVQGEVYKWKDETGTIHFTDDPSKIPRAYRGKTQKLRSLATPPRPTAPKLPAPNRSAEFVVPLTSRGNQFFVKTILNGTVSADLLLDTGATMIVLSEKIGKQLGIRFYENMPQIQAETAAGKVWTPLLNLRKVRVGEAKAETVEAIISPGLNDIDGLLGMSFLNQFQMNLDRSGPRMTLKSLADPGDLLYGGKTKQWWREKFSGYLSNIKYHEKLTRDLRKKADRKALNVEKVVRHYRQLYNQLKIRARLAGVPKELQPDE